MEYNDYMKMPFGRLFDTVFTPAGEMKPCGREACRAMIERLEIQYGRPGIYGDEVYGKLNLPDAFTAAQKMLQQL